MNGEVLMSALAHKRANRVSHLRASHCRAIRTSRFRVVPMRPQFGERQARVGGNLHFHLAAASIAEDHIVDDRWSYPTPLGDVRLTNPAQFQSYLDHDGFHLM